MIAAATPPRPPQLETADACNVVRMSERLREVAALDDRNMRRHADLIRSWAADAAGLLDRVTSLTPKDQLHGQHRQ